MFQVATYKDHVLTMLTPPKMHENDRFVEIKSRKLRCTDKFGCKCSKNYDEAVTKGIFNVSYIIYVYS